MARRLRSATTAVAADSSSSSEEEEIVESDRETESSSGDVAQASPVCTTPGPSQTRKRMRRSVTWKKNVRRRRRNAGLRYTSDTTNAVVSIILYSAHVYALVIYKRVLLCLSTGNSEASLKDILWLFKAMF